MNWLDIAIIVILITGAIDGMIKGFIVSFFNIASIFISLICARFFSISVSNFIIKNTSIYDNLNKIFEKRMTTLNPLTLSVINMFKNKNTTGSLTMIFINIACFLCIFFAATMAINIVKDFLKLKAHRKSLRQIDRAGGLIIGFLKAFIFIFLFFAILTPVISLLPEKSMIISLIGSSKLAKYFFLYNFIIPWIQKINNV